MKILSTNKDDRLAEVRELYSKASMAASDKQVDFNRFDRQYRGDGEIDGWITNDDGDEGGKPAKAKAVWNISHKLVEGSIDTNIPQPQVTPALKCEHHVRNAARIANLIGMLLDKQPFEIYNDQQERTVKISGTAGFNVEWDVESSTHSTVGEVDVTPIRPQNIYPQPGITDINDVDYVFINYVTTRAELMRKYSLTEEDVEKTEFEPTYDRDGERPANDEEVVTLTVMWYINELGDVCRFAYSGDLLLEDDDDYYSRKVEYCRTCGRRRQICEADECSDPDYYMNKLDYDELTEDIVCSDGRIIPAMSPVFKDGKMQFEKVKMPVTAPDGSQVMDEIGGIEVPAFMEVQVPKMAPTRLPYYKPRKLPLAIRYNIRDHKSFWGISDMEVIREPQQNINKLFSRALEAAMKSGSALMVPAGTQFNPGNGIFEDIIEIESGADKTQFGQFSYHHDITQWIVLMDKIIDLASDLNGVTDTYLGQADNTAKSGYAKSIQVAQSAGRLASRKLNKQAHYADVFRIIFELYLAFADEPRAINHEDDDCRLAMSDRFNRNDFYEFDLKTGKWFIDDNYNFSVDPNGATEQMYAQIWEIVKADFAQGLYGDPNQIDTKLMAWQHLERLKYPFAKNIVESLKALKEQMIAAQPAQMQANAAQGVPGAGVGGEMQNMNAAAMSQGMNNGGV